MSDLKLMVLGALQLERAGVMVELETRKAAALLVYLAITRQSHTRDMLATLFWPEHEQSRARTYLRRALWLLKKTIGEEGLEVERQRVALNPEAGLWLDVTHFHHLLARCKQHDHAADMVCADCLTPLAEAAEQYRGDFLSGFSLPDAPEFDEWQFFQTEELRQELSTVLERLARGHSGQGAFDAAIPYARRLVALDPLNEPAQRQLMQIYVQAGRRHEALRQYQVCVETLETELGSPPSPETAALYQQIVGGDVVPSTGAATKPAWLPPARIAVEIERGTPLVGRQEELHIVRAKIDAGWRDGGSTILLAGVSGVGKTRLAYEALRAASHSGVATLMGAAYEQEGHLAYHPFIEAIDRYLTEQQRPPEENPITHYKPIGLSDLQQETSAMFKATAAFFTRLATDSPVVLFIDDLHAADEASLSLFHYLSRQTRSTPFILLATYRTDVTVPSLTPFGSLLNALYREHLSDVLTLKPLSESAGAEIINHILAGQAAPALVKAISDITEGNPFYVQELSLTLLKAGHLIEAEGRWRLRPGETLQVPERLQELLRERVRRLGPIVETVLTAGAVVGRDFRFAVLRRITELPDGDLFDALDDALDTNLLEETDYGYRFQHSLIRYTLYDGLSRRRRVWLHTRTAEAIETIFAERPEGLAPHIEALAFHYNLSDRRDKALSYLLQAAEKARAVFALEIANDYLERALALMDELGVDDPAQRWPVLEKLGTLAKILADTKRAVTYYEQALVLSPTEKWQLTNSDRVRLHRSVARTLIAAGRMAEVEHHLEAAMEIVVDTGQASLDYANLLYDVALWHWHNDEYQAAFGAAQRSLEIAEQLNHDIARAQAYEMLALACHSLGEWQQGLNFEQQRVNLVGPNLDVTEAFDAHL